MLKENLEQVLEALEAHPTSNPKIESELRSEVEQLAIALSEEPEVQQEAVFNSALGTMASIKADLSANVVNDINDEIDLDDFE